MGIFKLQKDAPSVIERRANNCPDVGSVPLLEI